MNGYFFYIEFPDKKSKRKATRKNLVGHTGNIVAVFGEHWLSGTSKDILQECICGVFNTPNSPVCSSSVSVDYLRDVCLRISEKQARSVHPELFKYLDAA